MISRVEKDREFIRNYRERLDPQIEKDLLLTGMGAAEASVKRYKRRLRSVGKAWRAAASANGSNTQPVLIRRV